MSAAHLSAVLALSSLLGATGALAFEQTSSVDDPTPQSLGGEVGTQDVTKQVWPQRTEEFPTYWFVRTNWKVNNPHSVSVQVNVRCARYGYDYWYWIPPYGTVTDAWGCEGAALYVFNNASQYSSLFVQATTW